MGDKIWWKGQKLTGVKTYFGYNEALSYRVKGEGGWRAVFNIYFSSSPPSQRLKKTDQALSGGDSETLLFIEFFLVRENGKLHNQNSKQQFSL